MDKKYMILCVAGQSNAVGFDESPVTKDYMARFRGSRIRQLGFLGEDNLKAVPLGACAQNFQDLRPYGNPASVPDQPGTKGMQLPLADLLLDRIPEDYDLLVLPCAYGGVGFTVGEPGVYDEKNMRPSEGRLRWGVNSPYYRAMKDRLRFALERNPQNQFLGVVWLQGEFDFGDGPGQIKGFTEMTEDFFATFASSFPGRVYRGDWNRDIWYNVETTFYWYTQGDCPMIWEHYRTWNPGTYVEIPRTTDTNAVNGTGSTTATLDAHFGNDTFYKVIAPAVAKNMDKRFV